MSQSKVTKISSSKADPKVADSATDYTARRRFWTPKQKLHVIAQIASVAHSAVADFSTETL
jgi:hypothetical protein